MFNRVLYQTVICFCTNINSKSIITFVLTIQKLRGKNFRKNSILQRVNPKSVDFGFKIRRTFFSRWIVIFKSYVSCTVSVMSISSSMIFMQWNETYFESCQTYIMGFFCDHSYRILVDKKSIF